MNKIQYQRLERGRTRRELMAEMSFPAYARVRLTSPDKLIYFFLAVVFTANFDDFIVANATYKLDVKISIPKLY